MFHVLHAVLLSMISEGQSVNLTLMITKITRCKSTCMSVCLFFKEGLDDNDSNREVKDHGPYSSYPLIEVGVGLREQVEDGIINTNLFPVGKLQGIQYVTDLRSKEK